MATQEGIEKAKIIAEIQRDLAEEVKGLEEGFIHYLYHNLGRNVNSETYYQFKALSYTVRDRLMFHWKKTWLAYNNDEHKKAYYLSMEFLMGRSLTNNLLNLGVETQAEKAMYELGLSLEEIEDAERDAGLGNGGLGRLAACFMDSCATLQLPVLGYGLRYEYGMFKQLIKEGFQLEEPDHWLEFGGYPWEILRSEYSRTIKFGGKTRQFTNPQTGKISSLWESTHDVIAVPFDVPVPGFKNKTVNTLRLWSAAAVETFDLTQFNAGSYFEAVSDKSDAENITMVLYPNDASENGKELRLRQQYFLVSASLQDVVLQWDKKHNGDFSDFAEFNVFQLNDTHPSLAIAELMRLLLDEYNLEWNEAWTIVSQSMAYTNHTLLPEALERWSVALFEKLLPRPLEIIYEINHRFLKQVAMKWPGDQAKTREMSIVDEHNNICMAYLAIVGSFSINGVAALHSQLLKEGLFNNFYQLWPERFNNKTNGVTQRRWMASANPALRALLKDKIGEGWITDLTQISKIEDFIKDKSFRKAWRKVKLKNKSRLADLVKTTTGVDFPLKSIFDVQVKRIHEYKRQLLNVLHVIYLYSRIKRGDTDGWVNRCVLIGGKAAPGYVMAKNIIKLVNNVADIVNNDPDVGDRLKIAFIPDYRVSAMEIICPGTDVSEQISTAGKEASGTGNMKFMMNGAITVGTLDGANVEILEAVGEENFFLFGLKAAEVENLRLRYNPQEYIDQDLDLQEVMKLLEFGHFNQFEEGIFDDIINAIKSPNDPWMTLADFRSYIDVQHELGLAFSDHDRWNTMSIINSARSGVFSTDRTMKQYNEEIWRLKSIKI